MYIKIISKSLQCWMLKHNFIWWQRPCSQNMPNADVMDKHGGTFAV